MAGQSCGPMAKLLPGACALPGVLPAGFDEWSGLVTVLVPSLRLLVTTSPKSACTSIKTALFQLENGFGFRDFLIYGQLRTIHDPAFYPAMDYATVERLIAQHNLSPDALVKFTVVRHPVDRLLSAYSNRVLHYGDIEADLSRNAEARAALEAKGLPVLPDLSTFIRHLVDYRALSRLIWLHTQPQGYFIGKDPGFYTGIFGMKALRDFEQAISDHVGMEFRLPHLQTGGEKISRSALSGDEVKALEDFYRTDFDLYGGYF